MVKIAPSLLSADFAKLGEDDGLFRFVFAGVVLIEQVGKGKSADFVLHLEGLVIVAGGLHADHAAQVVEKRHGTPRNIKSMRIL